MLSKTNENNIKTLKFLLIIKKEKIVYLGKGDCLTLKPLYLIKEGKNFILKSLLKL